MNLTFDDFDFFAEETMTFDFFDDVEISIENDFDLTS